MRTLFLALEGPLMSFGGVKIDDAHSTERFPAKSMIAGLLGNAMGLNRWDWEALTKLQSSIEIASRIDRAGSLESDFATAGGGEAGYFGHDDKAWTMNGGVVSRRGDGKGAIVMSKAFIADGAVTVAVRMNQAILDEDALVCSLKNPARPLFLGRKAYLPVRPVFLAVKEPEEDIRSDLAALEPWTEEDSHSDGYWMQWPQEAGGFANAIGKVVCDIRDWKAGFHSGSRLVMEGRVAPLK